MILKQRTVFFIILGILFVWFLYLERTILTPFILAGIFAYIFNPVVNFFYQKIKLPRIISIIIIYLIVGLIIFTGLVLGRRMFEESFELKNYINYLADTTQAQINTLPDWLKPIVNDFIYSMQKSKLFSPESLYNFFPKAISRIVSFFIFLFSAFYFLKEGREMYEKLLNFIPNNHRSNVEILIGKINSVFASYLRGQLFLVFLVSLMLFLALSILGVKFALILAIFSGFAEIVPFIGPITAGGVAALMVLITEGANNFALTPIETVIAVIIIYFLIRQFQDYFITPHVMGRITKIHPFLIFFAVLAGGHIFGILGFILAVPVVATIKILLEFSFAKIKEKNN